MATTSTFSEKPNTTTPTFFKKVDATQDQIRIIHTLKSLAGLEDDNYRTLLDSYFSVSSSKSLGIVQATRLIDILSKMAKEAAKNRFREFDGRYKMPSGAQLRMLESMWVDVSVKVGLKAKREAFIGFLKKRFRVEGIGEMRLFEVAMVKVALEAMKKQKEGRQALTSVNFLAKKVDVPNPSPEGEGNKTETIPAESS